RNVPAGDRGRLRRGQRGGAGHREPAEDRAAPRRGGEGAGRGAGRGSGQPVRHHHGRPWPNRPGRGDRGHRHRPAHASRPRALTVSLSLEPVTLQLHDTLSRTVREFTPIRPGEVSLYLCGATVQAPPHIGHLRSAVCFDVLIRWLEVNGYSVTYCRNVTDID